MWMCVLSGVADCGHVEKRGGSRMGVIHSTSQNALFLLHNHDNDDYDDDYTYAGGQV